MIGKSMSSMSEHDDQLLEDARGPMKAFDMNGNYQYSWYGKTTTFTNSSKIYEVFVYRDGSSQVSFYLTDEPICSSW